MNGSNSWEQQCCGKARVLEPFCLSGKQTGSYENVVSLITVSIRGRNLDHGNCGIHSPRRGTRWITYRTLLPGPYWPETGHAQMTWRASLVAFASATSRSTMVLGSEGEENAGIIRGKILARGTLPYCTWAEVSRAGRSWCKIGVAGEKRVVLYRG